jgi:thiamine biosynthesis lipoprotein
MGAYGGAARTAGQSSGAIRALTVPAVLVALGLALGTCASPPTRFEYEEPHMGTSFRVVLYAQRRELAEAAARAAFARIAEIEAHLSDYDPASELSSLSRAGGGEHVSDDLFTVLARASEISAATDGAFDVTVGPLSKLWRRAMRQGELPTPEKLAAAWATVGWRRVELTAATRSVRLLAPAMQIDLGGIAKGFSVDQALRTVTALGIDRALIAGAGDIAVSGAPPGKSGWTVAIEAIEGAPGMHVSLAHAAISTSGDTYRFLELDGVRYSHILDPRTGVPLTVRAGASVIAGDSTTADALATAMTVLGPARGLEVASRLGVQARVVAMEDGRGHVYATENFGAP